MGTGWRDTAPREAVACDKIRVVHLERDADASELRSERSRDDHDAVGPEGEEHLEIDFVRGRVSIDLTYLHDDRQAEGPESEELELELAPSVRPLRELDMNHDPELGPEVDVEGEEDDPLS